MYKNGNLYWNFWFNFGSPYLLANLAVGGEFMIPYIVVGLLVIGVIWRNW